LTNKTKAEDTFHPGHFSMKIPGQLSAKINSRGRNCHQSPVLGCGDRRQSLKTTRSSNIEADDRDRRTLYEGAKWSEYFAEALDGRGQEHDRTLWWRISDVDSLAIVEEFVDVNRAFSVCEPACGSGGTSILLAETYEVSDLVLVDIAPTALDFARSILPAELRHRTALIAGDAFAMPLRANTFDLTWNVGVIEHYSRPQIVQMVRDMLRVTRPGGVVMVALPNRKSVATLKAAILGSCLGRRWLSAIPGYRFDTEFLYRAGSLAHMLEAETGVPAEIRYAGSALWVGAPEALVRAAQGIATRSSLSFLAFLVLRK
jgi:SAM-dependent methyltransferase